jgi:hypothetical protein
MASYLLKMEEEEKILINSLVINTMLIAVVVRRLQHYAFIAEVDLRVALITNIIYTKSSSPLFGHNRYGTICIQRDLL